MFLQKFNLNHPVFDQNLHKNADLKFLEKKANAKFSTGFEHVF